jgi:hypothetical protein
MIQWTRFLAGLFHRKTAIGFLHLEGEDVNYIDHIISRADFRYNGSFFFGLPAGVYELVIHAQGYQPSTQKYSVMPGKQEEQRVTELKAEKQWVLCVCDELVYKKAFLDSVDRGM